MRVLKQPPLNSVSNSNLGEQAMKRSKLSQSGLSLIELMIALALSSILMLGLFQVFNSVRGANRLQDGFARVQESARVGMEILGRDIRNATFLGCAGWESFHNNVRTGVGGSGNPWENKQIAELEMENAVVGFNDVTVIKDELLNYNLTVGEDTGNLIAGTDAVILQGGQSCSAGKVTDYDTGTGQIKITNAATCGINQNDIVLITNCRNADLFSVTNDPLAEGTLKNTLTHGVDSNNTAKLRGSYLKDDSEVMTFYSKVYYIGMGQGGRPALYLRQLEGTTIQTHELIEGVDNLQILMGEDSDEDGSVDRYLDPEATNLENERVVTMKVRLTLESENNITLTGDQLTQDVASVFALRNRL